MTAALRHALQVRIARRGAGRCDGSADGARGALHRPALGVGQGQVAATFGVATAGTPEETEAKAAAVAAQFAAVGQPQRLCDLHAPREDPPALAELALHDVFLTGKAHPVRTAELEEVLREEW